MGEVVKITDALVRPASAHQILHEVADFYHVNPDDLRGGAVRASSLVEPRRVAMYLMYRLTQMSAGEIGAFFDVNHSVIGHQRKMVEKAAAIVKERIALLEHQIVGGQ